MYAGQAVVQVVKAKKENSSSIDHPFHSCQLEGYNRVLRSRERRMLCFRSIQSLLPVLNLLVLMHNIMGTGKGCLYDLLGVSRPNTRWNPFQHFLPRTKSRNQLDPPYSTPYRETVTKFRQQHSYQLSYLNKENLNSEIPLDDLFAQEELLMP